MHDSYELQQNYWYTINRAVLSRPMYYPLFCILQYAFQYYSLDYISNKYNLYKLSCHQHAVSQNFSGEMLQVLILGQRNRNKQNSITTCTLLSCENFSQVNCFWHPCWQIAQWIPEPPGCFVTKFWSPAWFVSVNWMLQHTSSQIFTRLHSYNNQYSWTTW